MLEGENESEEDSEAEDLPPASKKVRTTKHSS
jgi:hypothetical protein